MEAKSAVNKAEDVAMNDTKSVNQSHDEKSQTYTLNLLQTCEAHEDKVWCLSWHYSENLIITGSSDKKIKVWAK